MQPCHLIRLVLFSLLGLFGFCFVASGQVTQSRFEADELSLIIADALLQIHEARNIPARASGVLESVEVSEGTKVRSGDLISRIDRRETELLLEQAKLELEIASRKTEADIDVRYAEKSKAVALADLQRANESNEKFPGVVSATEMDRLKLLIEKHDAELEKAQFNKNLLQLEADLAGVEMKLREVEMQKRAIVAPFDGIIVEVKKRPGEWVEISETIVRIVSLDRLRIEAHVPVNNISPNLVGAEAEFRTAMLPSANERLFSGTVVFVSPEINPVNATTRIWIEINNSDGLLNPGIRGNLAIHPHGRADH